jgi:GNAT superfamily N-acetyltransferase
MQAVLERTAVTQGFRKLTTYKDIKLLKKFDVGNEWYLVDHMQDHIMAYREDSIAEGMFINGELAGAILVTDYDLMDENDTPVEVKYVDPNVCCIIDTVLVDHRYQHKGYATKLIAKAANALRHEGKQWLYADMAHEGLARFYIKNGFYRLYDNIVVKNIA